MGAERVRIDLSEPSSSKGLPAPIRPKNSKGRILKKSNFYRNKKDQMVETAKLYCGLSKIRSKGTHTVK